MIYLTAYLLNVLDAICTWLLQSRYGLEIELNPVGRWLFAHGLMWPVKIGVVGLALLLLYKFRENKLSIIGGWVALIVYSLICTEHFVLFILTA